METDDRADAPGWAAIDAALALLYREPPAFHVAPAAPRRLGGPVALNGLSGYRAASPPHFHLVTYGLSELYRKESSTPWVSGWGLELTFRVATSADERPVWALNLLARVATDIAESGDPRQPGDRIDTGALLVPGTSTPLRALAFIRDPQLGEIDTPNGHVLFLQLVGLTADELALARRWRTDGVLAALAEDNPLLITDPSRPSLLTDPVMRARLEAMAEQEQR